MNTASDTLDAPAGAAGRARMLLDLCHMTHDPEAIRAAVELARLLRRDLLGIYVEDEAVQRLASLPFARELRMPSQAWSPLGTQQIADEFRCAAAGLQAMLRHHATRLDVRSEFQAVRGDPAGYVAGLCGAADVVLLTTPGTASARIVGSFAAAWRAAIGSPAAALLLPPRLARHRGPVVAVLQGGAQARARAAARLAAAAGESLVLLVHGRETESLKLRDLGREAGLVDKQLSLHRLAEPTPEALVRALHRVGARMVMLDRVFLPGADAHAATRLSDTLGVPLLFD